MAKRKITIHEEIEIDLEYPIYLRIDTYSVLFAQSEESNAILVNDYYDTVGFQIRSLQQRVIPEIWFNCPIITKEEFESEFKKVQEKINQLL